MWDLCFQITARPTGKSWNITCIFSDIVNIRKAITEIEYELCYYGGLQRKANIMKEELQKNKSCKYRTKVQEKAPTTYAASRLWFL